MAIAAVEPLLGATAGAGAAESGAFAQAGKQFSGKIQEELIKEAEREIDRFRSDPVFYIARWMKYVGFGLALVGGVMTAAGYGFKRIEQGFLNDIQDRLGQPRSVSPTPPKTGFLAPKTTAPPWYVTDLNFITSAVLNLSPTDANANAGFYIAAYNATVDISMHLIQENAPAQTIQDAAAVHDQIAPLIRDMGGLIPGGKQTVRAPVDWDSAKAGLLTLLPTVNALAVDFGMRPPYNVQLSGTNSGSGTAYWDLVPAIVEAVIIDLSGIAPAVATDIQAVSGDISKGIAYLGRMLMNLPQLATDAFGYTVAWGAGTIFEDLGPILLGAGVAVFSGGFMLSFAWVKVVPRVRLAMVAQFDRRVTARIDGYLGTPANIATEQKEQKTETAVIAALTPVPTASMAAYREEHGDKPTAFFGGGVTPPLGKPPRPGKPPKSPDERVVARRAIALLRKEAHDNKVKAENLRTAAGLIRELRLRLKTGGHLSKADLSLFAKLGIEPPPHVFSGLTEAEIIEMVGGWPKGVPPPEKWYSRRYSPKTDGPGGTDQGLERKQAEYSNEAGDLTEEAVRMDAEAIEREAEEKRSAGEAAEAEAEAGGIDSGPMPVTEEGAPPDGGEEGAAAATPEPVTSGEDVTVALENGPNAAVEPSEPEGAMEGGEEAETAPEGVSDAISEAPEEPVGSADSLLDPVVTESDRLVLRSHWLQAGSKDAIRPLEKVVRAELQELGRDIPRGPATKTILAYRSAKHGPGASLATVPSIFEPAVTGEEIDVATFLWTATDKNARNRLVRKLQREAPAGVSAIDALAAVWGERSAKDLAAAQVGQVSPESSEAREYARVSEDMESIGLDPDSEKERADYEKMRRLPPETVLTPGTIIDTGGPEAKVTGRIPMPETVPSGAVEASIDRAKFLKALKPFKDGKSDVRLAFRKDGLRLTGKKAAATPRRAEPYGREPIEGPLPSVSFSYRLPAQKFLSYTVHGAGIAFDFHMSKLRGWLGIPRGSADAKAPVRIEADTEDSYLFLDIGKLEFRSKVQPVS